MIHKTTIIDPKAKISANVSIGAYSIIGPNVEIGANSQIQSHVSIVGHTKIGKKNKIYSFSILEDDINTMSTSLQNLNEDIMIVSQFTLAAITSKGTKPSFHKSAKPEDAKLLYYEFVNEFKKETNKLVEGVFGESMDIKLTNKGPITFNFKVE